MSPPPDEPHEVMSEADEHEPAASSSADRLRARFGHAFEPGQVLFREGDEGTQAFLLEEGRVRLIKRVRGVERSLMVLNLGFPAHVEAAHPRAPRLSADEVTRVA